MEHVGTPGEESAGDRLEPGTDDIRGGEHDLRSGWRGLDLGHRHALVADLERHALLVLVGGAGQRGRPADAVRHAVDRARERRQEHDAHQHPGQQKRGCEAEDR